MEDLAGKLGGLDIRSGARDGEGQGESAVCDDPADESPSALKERVREEILRRVAERGLLVPFSRHNPDGQRKIPYFVGCERAAERLAALREFRQAAVVKVNPSLAQMHLRKAVMRSGKALLVPVPALDDGADDPVLAHLVSARDGPALAQKACTKRGVARFGRPLTVSNWPRDLRVDLFVVGCVAVTREGVRLGKGRGFAEVEWAIMHWLGAVEASSTLVATTAHPAQVVDTRKLPRSVMAAHDLPVDLVVTPARTINVKNKLDKPECGILWDKLTEEDLNAMPVLRKLKNEQRREIGTVDEHKSHQH